MTEALRFSRLGIIIPELVSGLFRRNKFDRDIQFFFGELSNVTMGKQSKSSAPKVFSKESSEGSRPKLPGQREDFRAKSVAETKVQVSSTTKVPYVQVPILQISVLVASSYITNSSLNDLKALSKN